MIIFFTLIRIAFRALGRNKLRSSLTMLGIIIGVGAVIAMVSIGQGAQATIAQQIANSGSNMLYVWPGSFNSFGSRGGAGTMSNITLEDSEGIQRECSARRLVSPQASTRTSIISGNQNWQSSVEGVSTNYPAIKLWDIESGAFFTEQEQATAQRVCLLGKTVVDNLFPGTDPVGQEVRLRNAPWRVIGTLKPKGPSSMGSDQDDLILAPYTPVQKKRLGITHINRIMISAVSQAAAATAEQQITDLLRARHNLGANDENDFQVRNLTDMAELANNSNRIMTLLLGSIAFVSLIVGGIGVMNIMLVSVTERTREIGIRMAVGATGGDIQFQFLTEAVVLAVFGGLLGVTMGIGSAAVISDFLGWPTLVSTAAIGMAFTFAGMIGIGAGWYPARKASRLDPIEALRYE